MDLPQKMKIEATPEEMQSLFKIIAKAHEAPQSFAIVEDIAYWKNKIVLAAQAEVAKQPVPEVSENGKSDTDKRDTGRGASDKRRSRRKPANR